MKLRITPVKNALVSNQIKGYIFILLLIGSCFAQNANAQQLELLESQTQILNDGQTEIEINLYNSTNSFEKPLGNSNSSSLVASNCNTHSEVQAYNLTRNDSLNAIGCQPNDTLVICFKVFNFNSSNSTNSCQWLHGLVPDFGECIVPVNQSFEGEPGEYVTPFTNNSGTGLWQWFPDGVATYNDIPDGYYMPYEAVGAGWFYIYNVGSSSICNDPTNPNCTWGDGLTCSDYNGLEWEVCFEAQVICLEPGETLCEISFRTFGDGETGGWPQAGCESDEPWAYEFIRNCCDEPIITNEEFEFEVCSGDLFEVELTSDMDPVTTFEWTVSPNSNGATAGSGTVISDVLTNNTGVPVTVYYYVTPTCDLGCIGITYTFAVTINPEVEVEVYGFSPICEGDCVEVFAEVTSNNPYASCVWSEGQTDQTNIFVCPPAGLNTYSVTVTDVNACTGEGSGTVEVIPQIIASLNAFPGTQVCESELSEGVSIFVSPYGGTGNYSFQWSTGENGPFIEVVNPGTYSVTVYDDQFNCFPDFASVTISTYDNPDVFIFGPSVVCNTEPVVCFNGQPADGEWGGVADADGCISPQSLSPGLHTITYNYIDQNGCDGSAIFEVEILSNAQAPLNISCSPDINSIDFSWDALPGISSYIVNGVAQNGTSISFNNLQAEQDVTIIVEAVANGPCGGSIETYTCTSLQCPVLDVEITGPTLSCTDGQIEQLSAWPAGGVFTGSCIVDPIIGTFDPVGGVPGWNEVSYTLIIGTCEYSTTHSIWLDEPLQSPVISCESSVGEIIFSWASVPGATEYTVNGLSTNQTSIVFSNLQANESVTVTVEAYGIGNCGPAVSESTCVAEDCPIVNIQLEQVNPLCANEGTITLQSSEAGGLWSGSGIVDAVNGIFDPSQASLGTNTITYSLSSGNCYDANQLEIEVAEALIAPQIICNSTIDAVSFSWTEVVGATGYIVNGVLQNATTFEAANLLPGEEVIINVEAVGAAPCGSSFAQSSCVAEDCPIVNIQLQQVNPLCANEGTITLQSSEVGGLWSGSGIVDAVNGIFDPTQAILGTNTIIYSLSSGNCYDANQLEIEVAEALIAPQIICNSTVDAVSFSWAEVVGATGYIVNGVLQNATTFEAANLLPGEEVIINVEAVGAAPCGSSFAQSSCVAEDCPIVNIQLQQVNPLCANEGTITLQSSEAGGLWSGSGIIDAVNGIFDPSQASLGTNTIIYSLSSGNCYDANQLEIEVAEALVAPQIICNSAVDAVSFSWTEVVGATGYIVNGVLQNATTFEAANLLPGEEVSISVEAVGAAPCGSSIAQSSCVAEDCPIVNIQLQQVNPLCANEGTITLQSSELGGLWSGSGIVDAVNGIFDPSQASLGTNTITYSLSSGNCYDANQLEIEVAEALIAPQIICNSTVDAVSFSWAEVVGATGYIVNGILQNATTFEAANLLPGEEVSISVEAVGAAPCGSSFAQSSCVAEDCPIVNIQLQQVNPICANEGTITLQSSEAGGLWSGSGIVDAVNGIFDPSQASLGANTITYSISSGNCTDENEIEIEVDATLAAPEINCNSSLDAVDFSWTPVVGATAYIVNGILQNTTTFEATNLLPGEAITITVEAVGLGACGSSFAQSTCVAEDCPIVSIQLETVPSICQNNTGIIVLEATIIGTNETGLWSGPGIIDPVNGLFDPSDPALIDGENMVSYIYENTNCSQSESLAIEVNFAPEADAGSLATLTCSENVLSLSGSGTGIPTWTGPGIVSGADTNTPSINAPGIYTLTMTDPISACVATDVVQVTENISPPIAEIVEPDMLTCNVLQTTINSTGSNSNNLIPSWEGPGINTANMNLSNPEVDVPGLYTLTILNTNNGCLSEPVTVEVLQTITPPLSEIIVNGALDCNTNNVVVEGILQADVAYQWTSPSGALITDASFEATEEGNYVLVVTNLLNGCTATDTAQIESLVAVPLTVAGADQEINCYNELATLNGTASQSGVGFEYLWTGPIGSVIATPNQLETTVNASGLYTLSILNTNNGCSSADEVYVTADVVAPSIDAGEAQVFGCNTNSLTLSGTVSVDATSFQWMNTNQEILSTDLVFDITDPGLYILQATNSTNGCSSIDNVIITEDSNVPSDLNYEAVGASCAGDNDAYLEVQDVVGGTAPYQYSLNGEEFSDWNVWQSMEAGSYDLMVVDALGCTHSQTVIIPETQAIVIDLGGDMDLDLGESHTIKLLTNLSTDAIARVDWYPTDLIDCMDDPCMEVNLTPMFTMDVEVQVVDTMGCMMEGSVQLRVDKNRDIFIPNAFSPNGDGSNDLFYPQGVDLSVVKIKRMAIFNRWGGEIFVKENFPINDPVAGWDGMSEGVILSSGVYIYLIEVEYADGQVEQLSGDVLLMR